MPNYTPHFEHTVLDTIHYLILFHASVHFRDLNASAKYWSSTAQTHIDCITFSENLMISPLTNPLSLSPVSSRANRWDPHLENQPWLRDSGAPVARQRQCGRQTVASAGCSKQQQGGTPYLFTTSHDLFTKNAPSIFSLRSVGRWKTSSFKIRFHC